LAVGSVLALIPPLVVVLLSQSTSGCQGTEFNVNAHYSLSDWIIDKFEDFKSGVASTYPEVCFSLEIDDGVLDVSSQPAIWIPESQVWIDEADDVHLDDDESFVSNSSTDCKNLTRIPLGIITWSKYADLLTTNFTPIPLRDITDLAEMGWKAFTNGSIDNVRFNGIEANDSINAVYFAHGHPNHTSGGLLGLVAAYSDFANELANTTGTITFEKNKCEPDDDVYDDALFTINDLTNGTNTSLQELEDSVVMTTPIDYSLPWVMMSRGPTFLHMAFGAENEVAAMNDRYKEQLQYMWNDTLSFVYLEDSYLITHPMCKMTGASWYSSSVSTLADAFYDWITDEDETRIEDLEQYGLRPVNTDSYNATNTTSPTVDPTTPTFEPTTSPTMEPTTNLTTRSPTESPSTMQPTTSPTLEPTLEPTTAAPTEEPTGIPTMEPTMQPSVDPTGSPTTGAPTADTTASPTAATTASASTTIVNENSTLNTTTAPTASPTSAGSIITAENGCSATFVNTTTFWDLPSVKTQTCVRLLYQDVKRPLKLTLLLDVSETMQDSTEDEDYTRWERIPPALRQLTAHLEDSANITVQTFSESLHSPSIAATEGPMPVGILEDVREELSEYWDYGMIKADEETYFFEAFNETYFSLVEEMETDTEGWKYAIMVLTHPDVRDSGGKDDVKEIEELEKSLLDEVGVITDPENNVPVYALMYYGDTDDVTYDTLRNLADRTNGEFVAVTGTTLKSKFKDLMYFL